MKSGDFVVVDIETTGLSKHYHKITEIAAVRLKEGKVVGEFETLVDPKVHIPSVITRLTGIDDEMVAGAPTIDKVIPDFIDFLGSSILVAHSATFDYGFLSHNAEKHMNFCMENERLCTRKLATRLLPDLGSKRLGAVCEHLEIVNEDEHRAMGDTRATVAILAQFLSMLEEKGVKKEEDILHFERTSPKKIRESVLFRNELEF